MFTSIRTEESCGTICQPTTKDLSTERDPAGMVDQNKDYFFKTFS